MIRNKPILTLFSIYHVLFWTEKDLISVYRNYLELRLYIIRSDTSSQRYIESTITLILPAIRQTLLLI
jgi:hypothetical protein